MTRKSNLSLFTQRRPHRKSRNGCQQCKQKKIKCDENKPSCGHCKRFSTRCSFLGLLQTSSVPNDGTKSTPLFAFPEFGGIPWPSQFSEPHQIVPPEIGSLLFDAIDLELLYFYIATTSLTLSNIPERQRLWQQLVPQIAFTHQFLLRGILAFTALHLAWSKPERKASLLAKASAHHAIGLSLFRTTMLNITPQNCEACFAFSSLLVVYAWPSSNQTGDLFFSDASSAEGNPTVEWASLLRGVRALLSTAGEWIASGSMKILLYPWAIDAELAKKANPEVSSKLAALSQLWILSPDKFSPIELAALDETLALLHEAYGVMKSARESPVDTLSVALAWPIRVSEAFLEMVNQLKPEALVLLAHYSLLLNYVDQVWFMHGMSKHLLKSIRSRIGNEWERWIAWLFQHVALKEFQSQGEDSGSNRYPLF